MDKKFLLTAMAAAMTLTPVVTSCQGQQPNTSFEETSEPSPSYFEPKVQSGTMEEPKKSTTSYTLTFEAVTKAAEEVEEAATEATESSQTAESSEKVETETTTRSYTASPNVIIKNDKVVGTHPMKSESVTTTVTAKTPVQISTEPSSNSTITKAPTKPDAGKVSSESSSNTNVTPNVTSSESIIKTPSDNNIISEEPKEIQQSNQNLESNQIQQSNNVQELINTPQPSGKPQLTIPENQIQAIYTVADNDCLTQIADKYQNISAEEIARANNMDSINSLILPGQHLIIPKPNAVLPDTPSTEKSSNDNYYEVKNGESFWSIGSKFGISDKDLAKYNGMSTTDTIYPGDILKVPSVDECNIEPEVSSTPDVSNTPEIPEISEVSNVSDENSIEEKEVSNIQEISPEESSPFVELTDENVSDESISTENSLEYDSLFVELSSNEEDLMQNASDEGTLDENVSDVEPSSDNVSIENVSLESTSFLELTNENAPASNSVETTNDIQETIEFFETEYTGTTIGMGIYSLDGTPLFEYNADTPISGACTVKAPYAAFVLDCCEKEGIDIWNETLTYQDGMQNDGSGTIKNDNIGSEYTIAHLLNQLLSISDNTAYNILLSRFPLDEYQQFLDTIGGQQLYGFQYGTTTTRQRKNEWLYIYQYINSDRYYAYTLKQMLSGTYYCYLVEGMENPHEYLHKSGWCSGENYNSASDCAIIDNRYLVIVLSQDYLSGEAHTDIVNVLGLSAEMFMS